MNHHERRHPSSLRHPINPLTKLRRNLKPKTTTTMAGHRRPRPISRQLQHIRSTRQLLNPITQLTTNHRLRIPRRTKHRMLPQREISKLHLKRHKHRHPTSNPRRIRRHHIRNQRPHRLTISRNMMHHHSQHMLTLVLTEQPHPQRPINGHVEAGHRRRAQLLRRGDDLPHPSAFELGDITDQLIRLARDCRERCPQHLMPADDVTHRGPQGV